MTFAGVPRSRLLALTLATTLFQAACSDTAGTDNGGADGTDTGRVDADAASMDGGDAGSQEDSRSTPDSGLDTGPPPDATSGSDTTADVMVDAADDALADAASESDGGLDGANDVSHESILPDCTGRAFTPTFDGIWEDNDSADTADSDPAHHFEDLIVTLPAGNLDVEGIFAYGVLGSALSGERVHAFFDDCSQWVDLGEQVTDGDGWASFAVPGLAATLGRHEVRMVVQGDGTTAYGTVLLVPAGTQLLVTDIDGTLTSSDTELYLEILANLFSGDYVPTAYTDAQTLITAYANAGYQIIYLTGRTATLDLKTRSWLTSLGFPQGTQHFAPGLTEAVPTNSGVGDYKLGYLTDVAADHDLFRAYGNATTDIYAYLGAGIAASDVYIIGSNAGDSGTQAVSDYTSHLATIDIPPADQPY